MNIGNINKGGLSQSNPLNHRKIEKTDHEGRQPARPGNDKDEAPHRDSVAISEAGRRALEEEQRKMQDLDMARRVYDAEGALSDERRQEIMARIQSQYYKNPAVIDQIVARLGDDLGAPSDGSLA
ncbi:MAG: hypothetical protein SH809_12935 [Rhodothermales bacterium]|nr:hypothetical protein [Rhodothermales bacterium]